MSISCLLELSRNTPVVSSSQSDGLISREACVVLQGILQLPTMDFQGCRMLTDYTKHQYKYAYDKKIIANTITMKNVSAYLQTLHFPDSPRGIRSFGDRMMLSSACGGSQSFTTLLVTLAVANMPSLPVYATRFSTDFSWNE